MVKIKNTVAKRSVKKRASKESLTPPVELFKPEESYENNLSNGQVELFDYESIKALTDTELAEKIKELNNQGQSFMSKGTKYKQSALAHTYVLFIRKCKKSSDSGLIPDKIAKKLVSEIITSDDESSKKQKQKLVRALLVMSSNKVKSNNALQFIQSNQMKNLFNGQLKEETKEESLPKKKRKSTSSHSPKPVKPSIAIKNILQERKIKTEAFVIIKYKKKTSYLTNQNDISQIYDDYKFKKLDK